MRQLKERISFIINKIVADYDYIYDPEHNQNPSGYERTEQGWSKKDNYGKKTREVDSSFFEEAYEDAKYEDDYNVRNEMLNKLIQHKQTPVGILYSIFNDGNIKQQGNISKICQKKFNNESVYLDDNDKPITRSQLEKEYNSLKENGEIEDETFDDYVLNSTSGNGNLREFKYFKKKH